MKDTNHPSRFGFVKRQLVQITIKKQQLPLLLAIATGLASILTPIRAHADAYTFVPTGSLDGGRSVHNAVRLGDGRVK
jgi:hypothetical protein